MKPILLLAVMAIAGTGLGAGFLGNTIDLNVQLLGVGETDLASPIEDASIKFNVVPFKDDLGIKNVVADCIIESPQEIVKDSRVFCKLTDINDNVAAEGSRDIQADLHPNNPTVIPRDDLQKIASKVQNIHDVILVVQGPSVNP